MFHLQKTMDLPKSVLQTDSIYPLTWNLRWLYSQESEQHVRFSQILLYLREKYPILYVLIVIRIYCKIIISWNIMTTVFTDMYHCFRGMGCHHLQGNKAGVPHWRRRQQLAQKPLVHGYHIMWHHIPEHCNLDAVAVYCTTKETYWCHCLPSTVMGRGEGVTTVL